MLLAGGVRGIQLSARRGQAALPVRGGCLRGSARLLQVRQLPARRGQRRLRRA